MIVAQLDFNAPAKSVELQVDNENVTGGQGTWKQVPGSCAKCASNHASD